MTKREGVANPSVFSVAGGRGRPSRGQGGVLLGLYLLRLALAWGLVLSLPLAAFRLAGPDGRPPNPWSVASLAVWAVAGLLLGRSCVLHTLAFLERRWHRDDAPPELAAWPLVSILLPAHNEAAGIEDTLKSLLELDYPCLEVFVIDDGSTDATFELARTFEGTWGNRTVRVLRKPNGGKWSALNLAFQQSRGELALCLDADSRVDRHALRWLVARMADPRVAAVSGTVRVSNAGNLLTYCQALEYLHVGEVIRLPTGRYGTVLVVSGPLGLFRRSALEEVYLRFGALDGPPAPGACEGPFEGTTLLEDFDLSTAVLALGGRIVHEPRALVHTRAPARLFPLLNQRYRWARGGMQVARKYARRALTDPALRQPRLIGWHLATVTADRLLILPAAALGFVAVFRLLAGLGDGTGLIPAYWAGHVLLGLCTLLLLLLKYREPNKLALLLTQPLMEGYYALILAPAAVIAIVDEIRGAPLKW